MMLPLTAAILAAHLAGQAPAPPVAPPTRDASSTSVVGLPSRVFKDFGRLDRRASIVAVLAGGAIAAAAHTQDPPVTRSLGNSAAADTTFDAGSTLGGGYVEGGLAGAVYAIGLIGHHPRVAALGSSLLEAQAVNGVLTQATKYAVQRRRPDGGRFSFPSGHTSATMATADVLEQAFGWKVGLAAYAGVAYVGISRVAERKHYLSDVLFGAGVGFASARSVSVTLRTHRYTWRAEPAMLNGGAGVVITAATTR